MYDIDCGKPSTGQSIDPMNNKILLVLASNLVVANVSAVSTVQLTGVHAPSPVRLGTLAAQSLSQPLLFVAESQRKARPGRKPRPGAQAGQGVAPLPEQPTKTISEFP